MPLLYTFVEKRKQIQALFAIAFYLPLYRLQPTLYRSFFKLYPW
jgi:hypothetical protein